MHKSKEEMLKALRDEGFEDDTPIDYENIESASNILERTDCVDVSIIERSTQGDVWYEAHYHSKRVGKTIIMSHDFTCDYENIGEFVDAVIELQRECDEFEKGV